MIHVLASIKVKPGKRDILIEHLKSNIPNVIKEKGCIEYNSTIDVDYHMDNQTFDENMVTIIENGKILTLEVDPKSRTVFLMS